MHLSYTIPVAVSLAEALCVVRKRSIRRQMREFFYGDLRMGSITFIRRIRNR